MAGDSGTLSSSSITVNVGESGQITFSGGLSSVESADTNIATVTADGDISGTITITGVSAGNTTATVHWAFGSSTITITVINNEDTSFLNKRGLAYFWDKINNKKQDKLTAGDHINITDSTIKAVDYVHSEDPAPTSQVTPVVTNDMIADGTITAGKLASGATVKLTLSTSDIGEGAALAANTLYGVYQ